MKKRILIKNKTALKKSLLKKIADKKDMQLSMKQKEEGDTPFFDEFSPTTNEKKNLGVPYPGLKELPQSRLEQELSQVQVPSTENQNTIQPQQFSAYGREMNTTKMNSSNYFSTPDYLTSSAYDMKMQGDDTFIKDTRNEDQNRRQRPFSNEINFERMQDKITQTLPVKKQKRKVGKTI